LADPRTRRHDVEDPLRFMLITGWRSRSETFPLTWAQVDWHGGLERLEPGKLLHDLRRTAVRNLERADVSRSVAMAMTGHKTESVYRRFAIVAESDLREAGSKLAAVTMNGDSLGVLR